MTPFAGLTGLLARLRLLATRGRAVDDVTEELEHHVELLTERYVREGADSAVARLEAIRQVGSVTRVREEIFTMNSIGWLGALAHDFCYAGRLMVKQPGFALAAVATVALGIGATTAIFSVMHSVLLRPLPYDDPSDVFSAEIVVPERRDQFPSLPASIQIYLAWRRAPTAFSAMAALRPWECNITGDDEPERLGGAKVSANFFAFLGVPPSLGRGFTGDEEQAGHDRVVVISDALWRRKYGADPALVGRTIAINGQLHQVVGIAPPWLLVPTGTLLHALVPFASRVDLWRPIAPTVRELKNESWDHGVLVRLDAGHTLEEGRQQLEAIANEMVRAQLPDIKTEALVQLKPLRETYAGRVRQPLLLLFGAAALLLLTACATFANLLLSRVATRSGEFATRLALGAGAARIIGLTIAESTVLTLVGGALGVAVALAGVRWLVAAGPADLRLLSTTSLNVPLLTFALASSVLTALACGLYPAWRASRLQSGAALRARGRSGAGSDAGPARRVLVGAEMALATALLAVAGLLLHSFANVVRADRGYAIEGTLTADISLFGERYATGASRAAYYRDLVARVRDLPGVVAAGTINDLPAVGSSGGPSRTILLPTDVKFSQIALSRPVAVIRSVTSGYFSASATVLLAGRFLTDDEPDAVAVISDALVRRLWPGHTPASVVGRQFRQSNTDSPLVTVTGVVKDARPGALDREPLPVVYRPYVQWASGPMTLVVRTAQDPEALAPAIRAAIRSLDAGLPIVGIRTMREIVSTTVRDRQFQMLLTSAFALLALLLGVVGLYGVVSYAVACSTREIGLKMALGAARGDVVRAVFVRGVQPVVAGSLVGLVSAVAVGRWLRSLLFDVEPADPLALGLVACLLLAAAGLACYVPARRAAGVDPVVALRAD